MGYNTPLGDFFAGGLLMRDFDEHKFHRRIMQTAFKIDAMRSYVDLMHPIIDRECPAGARTANSISTPTSRPCYWMLAPRCSWAWIWRGLRPGPEPVLPRHERGHAGTDPQGLARAALSQGYERPPGTGEILLRPGAAAARASGNDMATFFSNEKTEDGEYFSDKVVGEHLIFLLLAAHDTTTSALTMAAYYLAHDQQWQDRLREELQALGKTHLEYEDLAQVTDLDHCFKEVLRMNPPVPMMMRRTVKEVELGGYLLQPHTMVQISPLYTQRMEQWWTNPHQFDPDRFTREEHKQHSFLWAPFGGGAHKCIGLHFRRHAVQVQPCHACC